MGSRAISKKCQLFCGNPAKYIKSVRAIETEFSRDYWKFDYHRRRFERISEKHSNRKKFRNYWLIDLRRFIIARSVISCVKKSNLIKSQKVERTSYCSLKDAFNRLLLQICLSYIGTALFELTKILLPLLPLVVILVEHH